MAYTDKEAWQEYDAVADMCALTGVVGRDGDALPPNISARCLELINEDTDAFRQRIKLMAYARAMGRVHDKCSQPNG